MQYFIPLEKLIPELGKPQIRLFLGLVNPDDEEGTRNRISTEKRVIKAKFGVATECGMGRFTREQFRSVLEVCASVAVTYKQGNQEGRCIRFDGVIKSQFRGIKARSLSSRVCHNFRAIV